MSGTDWNDLRHLVGRDEVRRQLLQQFAMSVPVNSPDPSGSAQREANGQDSPGPTQEQGAEDGDGDRTVDGIDLAQAMERFAWTAPDGQVWDQRQQKLLKANQLRNWLGKALFDEWKESEQRRTVEHASVSRAAAAAQAKGSGELGYALRRYVLLYPSQSVWDREKRMVVALNDLRALLHRWYTPWMEHPERQVIDKEKLVFDPTQQHRPEDGYINMFRGLPLRPVDDEKRCWTMRWLVSHLCNHDQTVYEWLMCWLALPLQQVGAKLSTAVMMHSEQQGSGKSLLFELVVKELYGEYGATLGQHQLESLYTDWKHMKLFGLFEEVLSRDQKYSHTGTIKHMITGSTHRIEQKFVSGWEEANHMNAVFLSNELQPFPVEPSDRRLMVIWPEKKLPTEYKDAVLRELAAGGLEAFYGYLIRMSLTWTPPGGDQPVPFDTHTEPPVTQAKERLIDFGRPSWDLFYLDWSAGRTEWPYETVMVAHLYEAYRRWCNAGGERPMRREQFSATLAARLRRKRDAEYSRGVNRRKGTFFVVEDCPPDKRQADWLGERAKHWEELLDGNPYG